ncbi:MAG: hypothetical protein GX638_10550 [Crenarchaeota archaeon]|nr:hypothetical protein [Thermoproteota archaeon]
MQEKILDLFLENNPHVSVKSERNEIYISNPWGVDDCRLVLRQDDSQAIKNLNSLKLNPRLDAIIHTDKNVIEFAFIFMKIDSEFYKTYSNRRFEIIYNEKIIKCYFGKPTDIFFTVARCYQRMPSDSNMQTMSQLLAYHDYCFIEELKEENREYFINREPVNFFVDLSQAKFDVDIIKLCRQINFIMQTYDRHTPLIFVRENEESLMASFTPTRYIKEYFPDTFVIRDYDEILLRLIEVATQSKARQSVLYYYQIFEYAGYYYIDYKTKRSLIKVLKDPCIISCCDGNIDSILEILTEINNTNNNDDSKIRKVIEEKCDPLEIWKEVEHDKEFFIEEHLFDGGYNAPALISRGCNYENWLSMWHPKLIDHLTKIRNCIVHARERRENKIILPTKHNHNLLSHYLPVMERMSRQLVNMLS